MRKRQFSPTLEGAGGMQLEGRVVLSTLSTRPAAMYLNGSSCGQNGGGQNGGGQNGIPFVYATRGVSQQALNFTSNTYYQIVSSQGGGVDGLGRLFNRYGSNGGNYNGLVDGLSRLAGRVPYGRCDLLPIWLNTLESGGGKQDLVNDLRDYVNGGVGYSWNVLQSQVRHSTDGDLVFNGRVR